MFHTPMNARAGGTIMTSRFVIPDTTHANGAIQAIDGTVRPLGISGNAGRVRPDPDFSQTQTDTAATVGEMVTIYGEGAMAVDLLCAAAWNPGDLLMPDADGKGVVATATHFYGARAQGPGVIGALCPVDVLCGVIDS